jgi:hypothetical protein
LNQLKMNGSGLDCKILNNRHWFDCFELIKGYIISNWIGYDMELNFFKRWTSKHSNCYQQVKIDICRIKIVLAWDWSFLWC